MEGRPGGDRTALGRLHRWVPPHQRLPAEAPRGEQERYPRGTKELPVLGCHGRTFHWHDDGAAGEQHFQYVDIPTKHHASDPQHPNPMALRLGIDRPVRVSVHSEILHGPWLFPEDDLVHQILFPPVFRVLGHPLLNVHRH